MILALLTEGDMHPYEMQRLLRARGDERLVSLQNGTFYHQIATLVDDGLISDVAVEREGNRPTRTVYTLLPAGAAAVTAWTADRLARTDREADFRVALAEAHNLPRDQVAELVERRCAMLRDALDELESGVGAARQRGVDAQYLIELDRDIALRRADLAWTDTMLATLTDGSLHWGTPSTTHPRRKDDE